MISVDVLPPFYSLLFSPAVAPSPMPFSQPLFHLLFSSPGLTFPLTPIPLLFRQAHRCCLFIYLLLHFCPRPPLISHLSCLAPSCLAPSLRQMFFFLFCRFYPIVFILPPQISALISLRLHIPTEFALSLPGLSFPLSVNAITSFSCSLSSSPPHSTCCISARSPCLLSVSLSVSPV